ncbi:MAG TPA: HD domain-containing protein [Deltaproteobacteria bacterium]|nr:HD domain-containing protein [Deltaproteobacteria bacterium]HPJ94091.1 HD domain-containing protein [Deltaproteobacteria bacterium]HPR53275.1 HD domain-containing protein [Deltaproteobacteria bacterium]
MISKGGFVTELHDGDSVRSVFIVSDRRVLIARNGKPYAKVLLTDRTGDLPGIIWEDARTQIAGIDPGDIVGVRGTVESYENRTQMRIDKIVKLNEDDVDMSALVPTTKGDISSMMSEIEEFISRVQDTYLKKLIENIFSREGIRDTYMKAPAAKGIHHNYIGGLLEHTLSVLKSIEAIFPVYAHLGINKDLLIAGALLHDIGKIYEYSYDKVIDMTPEGRLIGHIYLSAHMTDKEIDGIEKFPEELKLQLLHLILGHHGQLEFGSPKLPMTREAMLLHMLDDLDAKLIGFSSIIESTPEEEAFTSYSSVYNRYLYTKIYRNEE